MLQLNYSVVKAGVYSVKCYSENCFKSVSVKYSSMPAQPHLCNYEWITDAFTGSRDSRGRS